MKLDLRTNSQKLLDAEIERLTESLKTITDAKEYATTADNVRVLCEAREKKNPVSIDTNTLIAVGANLLGILVVLNFERTGSITSKAFGMLFKGKSS